MATNLKDKFKILFHPVILSLILSLLFVSSYPILKNFLITPEVSAQYYFKDSLFGKTLAHMTQYLVQTRFDESIPADDIRFEKVDNLKYFIHDKDRNLTITNIEDISLPEFKLLTLNSQFYTKIDFTDSYYNLSGSINGQPFTSRYVSSYVSENLNYNNLDVYYLVPTTLSSTQDFIVRNIASFEVIPSLYLLLTIGAIALIILILINSLIPYRLQSTFALCRGFNKLLWEFKLIPLPLLALILFFFYSGIADEPSSIFYINKLIIDTGLPYYIVGIVFTFLGCLILSLINISIKSIDDEGLKDGLVNRIGLISIGTYFYKLIRKYIPALCSGCITLTKHITISQHIKIPLLLGLNVLIISFIGMIWYDTPSIGFICCIIYNILLFYFCHRQLRNLAKLQHFSNQLAKGQFDACLEEKTGFFQPIADNLNIINKGFKMAVEEEVKSQNMKTELISNVSHDLKTPLTSIITYVDLLKETDLPPTKQDEYIAILDRKSKRLKILIEDLFEASKAASGNIELHLENLDLVALLKQTLGELEEKITATDLQLRPSFPETKLICHLDGRRTYRIFENLISNIIKYAQPGSRVYMDMSSLDGVAQITFKNISAYEMNFDASEITERFNRGDASRHTEGSGLGLAIAKSLTELQQGNLTVHIDGDLFKVIITFPLIQPKVE